MITPNALCFGDKFPATGQPCSVNLSSTGLTVHFDTDASNTEELTVPFSAFSISAGGLNHDHLVVKWGNGAQAFTLYLKDPSLIKSLRTSAPPELTRAVEMTAAKVRKVRSRQRTVWGIVLGLLGGLALLLWFGSDLLVELAVDRIPVEWEQKVGESAYRDFLLQQVVLKEGPAVTAVDEMTSRLKANIPNNPYRFEISVVKNEAVNAFALPGGYVVVFTGLLKKAESGEEVAGVISHELNHVLQRHGLNRIVKQIGLMATVTIILGDQQGLIGLMKEVGV
jgi:Zn-dependent protease with chaperone function